MGAYNFKPQFEDDIMADRKRHTIRAKRKHPDKPGSICHLFVGMRTKKCRLLKRRRCVKVQDILIYQRGDGSLGVVIDGVELWPGEKESFALSDGFQNFGSMSTFWLKTHNRKHGPLDFHGDLIHWESDKEAALRARLERIPVPNPPRKNSPWKRRKKTLEKRRRKIARQLR
jgi:hypothetical protein